MRPREQCKKEKRQSAEATQIQMAEPFALGSSSSPRRMSSSTVSGSLIHHAVVCQSIMTTRETSDRLIHSSEDRKSTRLNSSHLVISYAVFCLKKKKDVH